MMPAHWIKDFVEAINQNGEHGIWTGKSLHTNDEVIQLFYKDKHRYRKDKLGEYAGEIVGDYVYVWNPEIKEFLEKIRSENHMDFTVEISP
jgi:hypothetical protein